MDRALIIMSGGTTTVINATLVGLVEGLNKKGVDSILAGRNGLPGVYDESFINVNRLDLDKVYYTPGSSIIGTSRGSMSFDGARIAEVCDAHNIKTLFNIGGNGTIQQTKAIGEYLDGVQCIALPKTVDNDLGDQEFEQMLFTPGFPSVVNYWCHKLELLNNENIGAYGHDTVLIAQTFGRETGFIAGGVRLADPGRTLPLLILLPEDRKDPQEVLDKIKDVINKKGRCIVIMSEGYMQFETRKDGTGQSMYGSSGTTSMQMLIDLCMESGIGARGVNYTVDQRQDYRYTTTLDLNVAEAVGRGAGQGAGNGFDFFSTYTRYNQIKNIPLAEIPGDYSRVMKKEWIGDFDVTDAYLKYLKGFMSFRSNSNFIKI